MFIPTPGSLFPCINAPNLASLQFIPGPDLWPCLPPYYHAAKAMSWGARRIPSLIPSEVPEDL
jgi:hypothetical protein